MKRAFTFLLALTMSCTLWACGEKASAPETTQPTQLQEQAESPATPLPFSAQYIRTDWYQEQTQFPGVQIIDNRDTLDQYYQEHLEFETWPRQDGELANPFEEACVKYDDAFFEQNYLLFLILAEGSGSVRHTVHSVEQTGSGQLEISVESVLPGGIGTADMAYWHIILELERPVKLPTAEDISVYWNGRLAYQNGQIVKQIKEAAFQSPPKCEIRSQSGEISLKAVNFDWSAQQADGTVLNTLTDLAMRPISPEGVSDHLFIDPKYSESIYAPVKETGAYAPTNSRGYFVKLHLPGNPSQVSFSCQAVGEAEEKTVYLFEDTALYAWPGGHIYEITATWEDQGEGYWGTATYYVYITDQ